MRLLAVMPTVLLVLACGKDEATPSALEAFAIDPTPALEIGTSEGDPALEFNRMSGFRRLPDGRIVVADGATRELRWFAPDGRHLATLGRRGSGPGEFQGVVTLLPWAGDSLAAFDANLRRVTTLSHGGALGWVGDGATGGVNFDWAPWVYRRAVILGTEGAAARSCVIAALDAMPLPPVESGLRLVQVDDVGRLWVRESLPAGVSRWTVWRRDGTPLGEAAFPTSFQPSHIGADFALGRGQAADETERVHLFTLRDERQPGECLSDSAARASDGQPAPEGITAGLRNLVTAQEAHYAGAASYTDDPSLLPYQVDERFVVWFLSADSRGWVGGVMDRTSAYACVMSVGGSLPGAWLDGVLSCG